MSKRDKLFEMAVKFRTFAAISREIFKFASESKLVSASLVEQSRYNRYGTGLELSISRCTAIFARWVA